MVHYFARQFLIKLYSSYRHIYVVSPWALWLNIITIPRDLSGQQKTGFKLDKGFVFLTRAASPRNKACTVAYSPLWPACDPEADVQGGWQATTMVPP